VNSDPLKLGWKSKNDPALQELACDLNGCFQNITRGLARLDRKSVTPPTAAFRGAFREYREKWKGPVETVAAEWMTEQLEVLNQLIERIGPEKLEEDHPELAKNLLGPPDFDPTIESAYDLLDDIFWWAHTIMDTEEGTDTGDSLHKAFQAWYYFQDTIGVDLQQIWHRWSKAQTVFVPPHVAAAHGPEEKGGLFDLLNEAYKAFVFGAHGAAIAMCRALTETVLVKHYGLTSSELKDVIVLAEKRYPRLHSLKLQDKRRLANRVLHRGEKANEDAVLAYLATVKELIEMAPIGPSQSG
jgi:hypothetical protein